MLNLVPQTTEHLAEVLGQTLLGSVFALMPV